jgi:hypothetical protein
MSKKQNRRREKAITRAVLKMRRQALEKAKPQPEEPKVVPEVKDNTALFERRNPDVQKEIAEWDVKKDRLKAQRMHEEFKKTFIATGKTGKEAFAALDAFIRKLKSELKDRTVRDEAVQTVKVMKKRLLTVLSIPKNPGSGKN